MSVLPATDGTFIHPRIDPEGPALHQLGVGQPLQHPRKHPKGLGDLLGDRQRFIDRDRPLSNAIRQRRSLDQFEDQDSGA